MALGNGNGQGILGGLFGGGNSANKCPNNCNNNYVMTEEEFDHAHFAKQETYTLTMQPEFKEPIYETARLEQERREDRFRKEQNKLRARFYKRK